MGAMDRDVKALNEARRQELIARLERHTDQVQANRAARRPRKVRVPLTKLTEGEDR